MYVYVSVSEPAVASCVQRPVDVVFLLDGSERMGLENHRRAKEFIENVARRLVLASGPSDEKNARFSLLQYGSPAEQRVEFPLTHELTQIADSLAAVNYMDSSSALGSAIIHAVNNVVIGSTSVMYNPKCRAVILLCSTVLSGFCQLLTNHCSESGNLHI